MVGRRIYRSIPPLTEADLSDEGWARRKTLLEAQGIDVEEYITHEVPRALKKSPDIKLAQREFEASGRLPEELRLRADFYKWAYRSGVTGAVSIVLVGIISIAGAYRHARTLLLVVGGLSCCDCQPYDLFDAFVLQIPFRAKTADPVATSVIAGGAAAGLGAQKCFQGEAVACVDFSLGGTCRGLMSLASWRAPFPSATALVYRHIGPLSRQASQDDIAAHDRATAELSGTCQAL
jgi:hypothetical protein